MKGNRQVHSLYNHQDLGGRYDLFTSLTTTQATTISPAIAGTPGPVVTNTLSPVSGGILAPEELPGLSSSSASVHSDLAVTPPVITEDNHKHCLNFIHIWSTDAAGIMVATPLVLSLAVCIVWPLVAVQQYRADVQTSTQTATAVASFLLTASESPGTQCHVGLVLCRLTSGARCPCNCPRCIFGQYEQ